jgi:hypothetical protein
VVEPEGAYGDESSGGGPVFGYGSRIPTPRKKILI